MEAEEAVTHGLTAFQSGNVEEAESAFLSVLKDEPNHAQALHGHALVLHKRGDAVGAQSALHKAIAANPGVAGYHNNLGFLLQEEGKLVESRDAFIEALMLDPLLEDAYENMGWLLNNPQGEGPIRAIPGYLADTLRRFEQGASDDAIEALQKLKSLEPRPGAQLIGCIVARSIANWESCVELLTRALPDWLNEEALTQGILKTFRRQNQYASALAAGKRLAQKYPENASYHFNVALLAQKCGSARQSIVASLRRALEVDPGLFDARLMLAQMHKQDVAGWHFAMMNDKPRNEAFDKALQEVVKEGDLVLEIGAGSGLLSMMAARAGAQSVVACELVEDLACVAREITKANGYGDRITIHQTSSENLRVGIGQALERPADVLVAEVFDTGLLGEKATATFQHARAHLLKPGGTIIPAKATVYAALFESKTILEQLRVQNENACGFDLGLFNQLGIVNYAQMDVNQFGWTLLTEPRAVEHYDFHQDITAVHRPCAFHVNEAGLVHGVMFWFDLELAPDVHFSTDPRVKGTHWHQAVQLLDGPRQVENDTEVVLQLISNQTNFRGIRFEWT